jgi:hypothetical protein
VSKPIALFLVLLFSAACGHAQDKVIFTDGSSRTGTVQEILPDEVILAIAEGTVSVARNTIVLITYRNGLVDHLNTPPADVVYLPAGTASEKSRSDQAAEETVNFLSVNSLALVNADFTVLYERLFFGRQAGAGVIGGFNFNPRVTLYNVFLYPLAEAKKNYDAGAFFNFYPGGLGAKNRFYGGLMVKYTSFRFQSLREDTLLAGNQLSIQTSYSPSSGSQLATLFTFGTHSSLGSGVYVRTLFGLGGFTLRGDYKEQFNYMLRRGADVNDPVYHYSFVPKIYLGLNFGISL